MEFVREVKINNENDTKIFGMELANNLVEGDVVALIGDLGVGKTTLTKYIAKSLGINEEITSPTFLIVKSYEGRLRLNHFDIYRLNEEGNVEEALYNIGFEEYIYSNDVSIIEWADYVLDLLPDYTKYIYIERVSEEERVYKCTF